MWDNWLKEKCVIVVATRYMCISSVNQRWRGGGVLINWPIKFTKRYLGGAYTFEWQKVCENAFKTVWFLILVHLRYSYSQDYITLSKTTKMVYQCEKCGLILKTWRCLVKHSKSRKCVSQFLILWIIIFVFFYLIRILRYYVLTFNMCYTFSTLV